MAPRITRAVVATLGSLALAAAADARPPEHRDHDRDRPPLTMPWLGDPYPSTYHALPRSDLVIRHATILDGAGKRIDDGDLSVHDGRIVAIGHGLAAVAGASEIDARGRWLTPGLIDPHSHDGTYVVPLTSVDRDASDVSEMSDWNVADTWIEHAVNPQDPAFALALAGGVTTLQVLPGSSPLIGGRSVVLKPVSATTMAAMKFPDAPAGLKMACGENPKLTSAGKSRAPTSRQGEIALLRKTMVEGQDYIRGWRHAADEGGRPPPRDLRKDTIAALLEGDLRLNVHCYRADEMATMIALSHEFGFKIASFHHAVEGYKIAPLLKAERICAAVWPDWWGFKMEALDGIRENAAFLSAAGVCTMMHSDSPAIGQRLAMEAAKAAGVGRRAGLSLPPETVIEWVTRNPAIALGLADRIGTIAPGMNADLVVWSGDLFSVYSHADTVLIDGAVAFDRHDPARQPRSDFALGRPTMVRP